MKLKWPVWLVTFAWMSLHLLGFLSIAEGWLTGVGLVFGLVFYLAYGAFAQMVGYGVIAGKKAVEAWRKQIKDPSKGNQPGAQSPSDKAWGYLFWILLPIIIYFPFFIIALSER